MEVAKFTIDFSCFYVCLSSQRSGASIHKIFMFCVALFVPEIDRAYGEVSDRVPVYQRRCSSCT